MINILPFRQSDSSRCGPAVIKMILNYYGIDALEDEICKRADHTYETGCDDVGMKKAIESYGLAVNIYNNSSLEDIEYWIKHHIPVIVDWFSGDSHRTDMANGHSSIIVGIDRERVYMVDPDVDGIRDIPRGEFMRVWFDWKSTPHITKWEDMVLRQAMIVYPARLKNEEK